MICKKCLNNVIRQRNGIKMWKPNIYWILKNRDFFSSANSSTGYLPKLIFVEHLLCAMHHAGIWRYTAELDLVLAQDPRPDGRYGLAAVGSEVVVCLHELPQGFWSSFIIHRCFPRISTRRSLCWSRRSVNDLGLFGSLQAQNRVRCPAPPPGPSRRASHPDSRAMWLAGLICLRKGGSEPLPRCGFLTLSVG